MEITDEKTKRPFSLSVVSALLILMGIIFFMQCLTAFTNPEFIKFLKAGPIPLMVVKIVFFGGSAINVLCGVGMIMRIRAARLIFILWYLAVIGVHMATHPDKIAIIPVIAILLVVAFVSFRPKANAFFNGLTVPRESKIEKNKAE